MRRGALATRSSCHVDRASKQNNADLSRQGDDMEMWLPYEDAMTCGFK